MMKIRINPEYWNTGMMECWYIPFRV